MYSNIAGRIFESIKLSKRDGGWRGLKNYIKVLSGSLFLVIRPGSAVQKPLL